MKDNVSFSRVITRESLQLLRDLAANNRKEWFEAHRAECRRLLQEPLEALAKSLGGFMLSIDQDLITAPRRVVSRIHRDTRFSRDKSPYKTTMWLTFKRPLELWQDAPAWFFEMGAESWRYGMGFFSASPATMTLLRTELAVGRPSLLAAITSCRESGRFILEGEQYKRPPEPAVPEELREWGERKNVYLVCNREPDDILLGPGLAEELRSGFAQLAPLYEELWNVRRAAGRPH
ncbi:MAG: hypothetical protein A2X58_11295 [Nitrospirae bacterium GWC2_56_14]|nr:MAG: hypothetical protein A2X58_11295 [Nitrospirae bacterium GWC2_56_14]